MKKKTKNRDTVGVSGRKYVLEALNNIPDKIIKIFIPYNSKGNLVDDIIRKAAELDIKIQYDQKQNIPLGITAVIKKDKMPLLSDLYESDKGLYLAIDGVFDPHNLGAIIRSAYAFSVDAVILPERDACGLTDAASRTSAGAALYTNVIYTKNFTQAINTFNKKGFDIISTSAEIGEPLHTFRECNERTVIVLGNEEKGIKNAVRKLCTKSLKIEMNNIESLNLSVSAGIILHHFFTIKNKY